MIADVRSTHNGSKRSISWIVYTDTDRAGCAQTRKSTSGGAIKLGKHTFVKGFWNKKKLGVTKTIAKDIEEAEKRARRSCV